MTSESEFPSTVVRKGPTWAGFDSLEYLIIFGDSYSAVGYEPAWSSPPTHLNPLGVDFPGITYTEEDTPNWVGHLVTNYTLGAQLLVYDYAQGGARVHDVKRQIEVVFKRQFVDNPEEPPWTAKNSLFVTWVGINDCAWSSDHTANMMNLFEHQEALYTYGARNFLFINVPPIDRAPAKGRAPHYRSWNTELKDAVTHFAAAHDDATVMIYSSWDTFSALLDEPDAHGFDAWEAQKGGGSVWVDHLHPRSQVHDFVARDVSTFLRAQTAFEKVETAPSQ